MQTQKRYNIKPWLLQVTVNWNNFNKKLQQEIIQEETATTTYRRFIEKLFVNLTETVASKIIQATISGNIPLISKNPKKDYKLKNNAIRYHRILETAYFLNTNSDIKRKLNHIKKIDVQLAKNKINLNIEAKALPPNNIKPKTKTIKVRIYTKHIYTVAINKPEHTRKPAELVTAHGYRQAGKILGISKSTVFIKLKCAGVIVTNKKQ